MQVTKQNYPKVKAQLDLERLPQELSSSITLIQELLEGGMQWEEFENLPSIKDMLTEFFPAITEWIKENQPEILEKKAPGKPASKPKSPRMNNREKALALMPYHQQDLVRNMNKAARDSIYKSIAETVDEFKGQKGEGKDRMVYLHYFVGGSDWWITDYKLGQDQAFGYVVLNRDTQESEFDYMSFEELKSNTPVELDFYWTPKTLNEAFAESGFTELIDSKASKEQPTPHEEKRELYEYFQNDKQISTVFRKVSWFFPYEHLRKVNKLPRSEKLETLRKAEKILDAYKGPKGDSTRQEEIVYAAYKRKGKIRGFVTKFIPDDLDLWGYIIQDEKGYDVHVGRFVIQNLLFEEDFELVLDWKPKTLREAYNENGWSMLVHNVEPQNKTANSALSPATAKTKSAKSSTPKPSSRSQNPCGSKTKKANRTLIEDLPVSLRVIRRYYNLDGQTKTTKQILNFINYLQRAITAKQIRKTDKYASEVSEIQERLIKFWNKYLIDTSDTHMESIELTPEFAERLKEILDSSGIRPSVKLIRRYIAMHGKEVPIKRKEALLKAICKAINSKELTKRDPYFEQVAEIQDALGKHLANPKGKLNIHSQALNGLLGILEGCGCGMEVSHSNELAGIGVDPDREVQVFSATDPVADLVEELNFQKPWSNIFGNPERGFTAMVYGPPKNGKSTLMMKLAHYLAENHGSVLFLTYEQKAPKIIKEMQRLGTTHPAISIVADRPSSFQPWDFVIVDSVTRGRWTLEDMENVVRLYPEKGFLFIFQVTKDDKFRGEREFEHLVDVVIRVEDSHAYGVGRFGPEGHLNFGLD